MSKPPRDIAETKPASPKPNDLRCACGSLLARVFAHGVELKCRRCRRSVLVTLGSEGRFEVVGDLAVIVADPTRS
jgi:hypothetical protein